MKTDRELLELAARAAGVRGEWNKACSKFEKLSDEGWHAGFFEPLTDDGAALRLAVKLDMQLTVDLRADEVWVNHIDLPDMVTEEFKVLCPYAATRRAIVRAAAAIGEKL